MSKPYILSKLLYEAVTSQHQYQEDSGPERLQTIRLLLERGADPNSRWNGHSITEYAVQCDQPAIVALLLEFGAVPELCAATILGHVESVRQMVEEGHDVDAATIDGDTILQIAARYGHADMVALLLERGANPLAEGSIWFPPLTEAVINKHWNVVQLLCEYGVAQGDSSAIYYAVKEGLVEYVSLLIRYGAPIDVPAVGGETLLMTAVRANQAEVTRLLIARGAAVNAANDSGYTALMLAAAMDSVDVDIVQHLLEAGADPNTTNTHGGTALGYAEHYLHSEIATLIRTSPLFLTRMPYML